MVQVYRTHDLTALGLSPREIRSAERCCLRRIRRGHFLVIRYCDDPDHRSLHKFPTLEQSIYPVEHHDLRDSIELLRAQIRSRLASLRPGDFFSHVSAVLLHGIDLPLTATNQVEIIRTGHHESFPFLLVRNRPLADDETVLISSFPVTSVERTLSDIAHDHPLEVSVPVISSALRDLGTSKTEIRKKFTPGRRGCRKARIALELASPLHESQAESLCAVKFHRFGITDMIPQVDVFDETGRFIGRSDFKHRYSPVITEVHGLGKYFMSPDGPDSAARANHERHMRLINAGYRVFNLTWSDLFRPASFHPIAKAIAESRVLRREPGV